MTMIPGAIALILKVIAPPLWIPTTPAPAATSRNVPQVSAKRRRHSWAESKKSGVAEPCNIRCSGVGSVRSARATAMIVSWDMTIPIRLDDLAWNHGILIECINRAETVIAVSDYQFAMSIVSPQQQGR